MKDNWLKMSILETTSLIKDGTHGTHKDVSNGIPLLSAKDIVGGNVLLPDDARLISEMDFSQIHKTYKLQKDDVLLTLVGTIGRVAILKDYSTKFTFQRSVGILRFDEKVIPEYAYYYVSSEIFYKDLIRSMNASAQGGVYLGELGKMTICFPKPLPQQRKIATILSTCDEVIEKTEAAIAKYQALKQGMMHDLFTRGIDLKTGKLRPSYQDAPELYKESKLGMISKDWEVKQLGDCVENLDGKRIPIKKEDREIMKGNIPYYGASGIIDYVNDYIFNESLILLGEDGENVVARNTPLAFQVKGKTWVNNHAHVLKPLKSIDIDFLTELLEYQDYSSIISGSAQPKINQANLNKKLLCIPDIAEQKFTSSRIIGLNQKLKTEQSALAKYQKLKAGLMQDLLTGKVEVSGEEEILKN